MELLRENPVENRSYSDQCRVYSLTQIRVDPTREMRVDTIVDPTMKWGIYPQSRSYKGE